MPLVAFSIRLDRIEESLLFEASDGSFWLSCVCTLEEDAKGRTFVGIPRERYAAGEKGPALGTWREIGGATKPSQRGEESLLAGARGGSKGRKLESKRRGFNEPGF